MKCLIDLGRLSRKARIRLRRMVEDRDERSVRRALRSPQARTRCWARCEAAVYKKMRSNRFTLAGLEEFEIFQRLLDYATSDLAEFMPRGVTRRQSDRIEIELNRFSRVLHLANILAMKSEAA